MSLSRAELLKIPKVELHRHLECSLRLSTIIELAPQVGIEIPATTQEIKDKLLVTKPMRDLEAVLKKFLMTQAVLHSEEILTRITYEVIEDSYNEGIRILELRYAPTFIQLNHEYMDFEKIHQAIMKGVTMATQKMPIAVGLIALAQRILPVDVAEKVARFAIEHKDTILALDLADNEIGFNCMPFAPVFQKAKKAGLHITVHAGEAPDPQAHRSVLDSIEHLGAERIGHGLQIYKDPRTMDELARRKIPLEICPTSNWLTNAVPSLVAHPIRQLIEHGVPVTINSDDPGIFDIDLTNEYLVLARDHAFTLEEFTHLNDIAAAASFIPHKEKLKVWPRPINKSLVG